MFLFAFLCVINVQQFRQFLRFRISRPAKLACTLRRCIITTVSYCTSIRTVAEVVGAEELATVARRASTALLERLLPVPVSTASATHHRRRHCYFFCIFVYCLSWAPAGFFPGVWRRKSPSRVQGRVPVRVWGEAPRSRRKIVKIMHK